MKQISLIIAASLINIKMGYRTVNVDTLSPEWNSLINCCMSIAIINE